MHAAGVEGECLSGAGEEILKEGLERVRRKKKTQAKST